MRNAIKRVGLALLLAGSLAVMGGCAQVLTQRELSEMPPPDIEVPYEAPTEDGSAETTISAVLYFLNFEGTQLVSEVRNVFIGDGELTEEAVLHALFEGPESDMLLPLGEEMVLSTNHALELCNGVATVNLGAQARQMDQKAFYFARLAIANTLTQLPGIEDVNILVEGREEGLDLAAQVPTGTLSATGAVDIQAQWARLEAQRISEGEQSLSRRATLYFPINGGPYVATEVRTISIASMHRQDYVLSLLLELGRGAMVISDARSIPAPNEYLSALPEIVLMDQTAERVVRLDFLPTLDDALAEAGLTQSLYWAMLANTITGFVPGIDGVVIAVGESVVTGLPAQETVNARSVTFSDGVMRRADFYEYVAGYCYLYFPSQTTDKLVRVRRAMRQLQTQKPRMLIRELLKGPDEDESGTVEAVFPEGVTQDDFLALYQADEILFINVSDNFAQRASVLSRAQERKLVYSIVNTMTEIGAITRVYFFAEGELIDSLSGGLEMRGAFVRNPGMIEKYD